MEDIRKADPTFTGFVPRTAAEAVDRYVRCRRNGLKPMLVPECLIACATGLSPDELELFETWIINPNGSLEGVELVPDDIITSGRRRPACSPQLIRRRFRWRTRSKRRTGVHPQPPPARLPHEAQVALHALEHPVQVRQVLVRVPVELGVHLVLAEAPEQQPQAAQEELCSCMQLYTG